MKLKFFAINRIVANLICYAQSEPFSSKCFSMYSDWYFSTLVRAETELNKEMEIGSVIGRAFT